MTSQPLSLRSTANSAVISGSATPSIVELSGASIVVSATTARIRPTRGAGRISGLLSDNAHGPGHQYGAAIGQGVAHFAGAVVGYIVGIGHGSLSTKGAASLFRDARSRIFQPSVVMGRHCKRYSVSPW